MHSLYPETNASDESLTQVASEDEYRQFFDPDAIYIAKSDASGQKEDPVVNFFPDARYFHISGGTFIGHAQIHYHNEKAGMHDHRRIMKSIYRTFSKGFRS